MPRTCWGRARGWLAVRRFDVEDERACRSEPVCTGREKSGLRGRRVEGDGSGDGGRVEGLPENGSRRQLDGRRGRRGTTSTTNVPTRPTVPRTAYGNDKPLSPVSGLIPPLSRLYASSSPIPSVHPSNAALHMHPACIQGDSQHNVRYILRSYDPLSGPIAIAFVPQTS